MSEDQHQGDWRRSRSETSPSRSEVELSQLERKGSLGSRPTKSLSCRTDSPPLWAGMLAPIDERDSGASSKPQERIFPARTLVKVGKDAERNVPKPSGSSNAVIIQDFAKPFPHTSQPSHSVSSKAESKAGSAAFAPLQIRREPFSPDAQSSSLRSGQPLIFSPSGSNMGLQPQGLAQLPGMMPFPTRLDSTRPDNSRKSSAAQSELLVVRHNKPGYFDLVPSGGSTPGHNENSAEPDSPPTSAGEGEPRMAPENVTSSTVADATEGPHNPHAQHHHANSQSYQASVASARDILHRAARDSYPGQNALSGAGQQSPAPTAHSFGEAFVTARFEHQETEEGHMVVTGRKGTIEKCEDEPIHMPGAIQGFGVLLAVLVQGEILDVHENAEQHSSSHDDCVSDADSSDSNSTQINISAIQIVQCSENSGHLLGLPPRLLLSLASLTDILVPDQRNVLVENIAVLFDSPELDLLQAGPHNFKISGRGETGTGVDGPQSRHVWTAWCAAHRPDPTKRPRLVVLEFELENDTINPACTRPLEPIVEDERGGLSGEPYTPTEDDLKQSTVPFTKPLRALKRLRKRGLDLQADNVDVLSLLSQINEQFDKAHEMSSFLKMVVSVVGEVTGFHRVMIYQFDDNWNGQVVAELVDWKKTRDLYRGLHFPATDIPAQARELYRINRVRMLYDRDQPTARLVCRTKDEVENPLDMTHSLLRAMSPIHIKYLVNMGVRASFSISILSGDRLWGLISCHTYGRYGHRVTFPTRSFCRMLGESISRTINRIMLDQRLSSRKLINSTATAQNPTGYIVAKAEDLLGLFDAEFAVLSIGDEAKILGGLNNSQEVLAILEYLRIKPLESIYSTTDLNTAFPDMRYSGGFKTVSGLLTIPLSRQGRDFICFFRPGQLRHIHWAGNPYEKTIQEKTSPYSLEPRKSFKLWSETVVGKSRSWTDEQIETGSVLALVYGKFIDVWRQKEMALQTNQLQALLLSNASHEVRTPLNAIINYLEMALEGQLDNDTRDNLSKSYHASRALVHVINDLLDLTRMEQGNELFSIDPFDLTSTVEDAISVHRREAERTGTAFEAVEPPGAPQLVLGDRARIRQVISNLVGNAVKHTKGGKVCVSWCVVEEEEVVAIDELPSNNNMVRIAITVMDTGEGIPDERLEAIFRAFEQVDWGSSTQQPEVDDKAIGLGLAVVGRVVNNLGGQLRVESKVGEGSRFTAIFPFGIPGSPSRRNSLTSGVSIASGPASAESLMSNIKARSSAQSHHTTRHLSRIDSLGSHKSHESMKRSELDDLVEAISSTHVQSSAPDLSMGLLIRKTSEPGTGTAKFSSDPSSGGSHLPSPARTPEVKKAVLSPQSTSQVDSIGQVALICMESNAIPGPSRAPSMAKEPSPKVALTTPPTTPTKHVPHVSDFPQVQKSPRYTAKQPLRVLVVEDDNINRMIIRKKLSQSGHTVVLTLHGQEAIEAFENDRSFDIVLMDLQMPICDGFTATKCIRTLEKSKPFVPTEQVSALPLTHSLNGRIPILAVSASLRERQSEELLEVGMDGWLLKPIDFSRLEKLLEGATDASERRNLKYSKGKWENGGWLTTMR